MAVKLRLRRMGRKKRPIFAVVAADGRSPRDGRYIEDLGRYNPIEEPAVVSLEDERILYWLEQGAQPSHTVRNLLSRHGLMLALHMKRKGQSPEQIAAAVQAHREAVAQKSAGSGKVTARARREAALAAERERVAAEEAELARRQAEAEAKAQAEAEAAKRKAAEEAAAAREAAEAAAKAEQAAKNAAQAEADAAAPATEAAAAPAAKAAAEAPAKAEKEA